MSWRVSPWVYSLWDSLCLLGLIDYFLFHVGEIFNYNLFRNFLIPFLFLFFFCPVQFSSFQSLSWVRLFATPWITACQASLSITNSHSLLKLMPIESVMPSSHLILYCPLLLLPPISPSIRVFSNESTLCMRWAKYWSFSFSIRFFWDPYNSNVGMFDIVPEVFETILSSFHSFYFILLFKCYF